ncbi:MAG: glycine zipper 2TM domain-containing protein [Sphingobium sp.]|nr:glycine zipper 2TM domain-containing protein [Sphingobium sp.]
MYKAFRNSLAALTLGATVLGGVTATPAFADRHDNDRRGDWRDDDYRGDRHDNGRHNGWYKHDRDRDRVIVIRDRTPPPRIIYSYDYDRPDPRYGRYYQPNRYYRGGYAPIRVTRETRIYYGDDGRYYCRRSDGTTGLIVGAVLGGAIGDRLDRGRSSVLGLLLGAGAGAAIGQSIDRGQVVCR